MNLSRLNVLKIRPTQKDRDRAEGLQWRGSTFHGDSSPWRSQASKMSKLIKDPLKLVRRAMAVAEMYGTNDYYETMNPGEYTGAYYPEEWKKEKDAWTPFAEALGRMGFSYGQIRQIAGR